MVIFAEFVLIAMLSYPLSNLAIGVKVEQPAESVIVKGKVIRLV